ncbi:MAG TPA: alpha/beta hydrolase [Firmicutes bacterium]|nr:alpha/beta hydrolase [Bacillota bacterium]
MSSFNRVLLLTILIFVVWGSLVIIAFLPAMVTRSLINPHVDFEEVYAAADYGLAAKELELITKDGLTLAAWEVAVKEPRAVLIFVSDMREPSVTAFFGHARFLKEHGYASILVEMRAHGASEGEQIGLGYAEHLDILAALDYSKAQAAYQGVPVIPFGLGLGGSAAINAVGLYPELAGFISIAAFSTWPDLFRDNLYFSGAPFLLALAEKPFANLYILFKFGWSKRNITPQKQIAKLGERPALLMHSQGDEQVSYLNLERLLLSAPRHVEVFFREGSQHHFSENLLDPGQDKEYAARLLSFLESNFP